MSDITMLVCDPDLKAIAQPIQRWSEMSAELRFMTPGVGEFTAPGYAELIEALQTPDSRIVVQYEGEVFASGPVEKPGNQAWTPAAGEGLIRVTWATNEALLAQHITYPDPAAAATAQTVVPAYTATATNAEVVLRALVNLNAGPGALTGRQIPHLVLGDLLGVGTNVDLTTRFEPLTEVLRRVAAAGGGLGWWLRQDDTQLKFEVWEPTDASGYVRFSRGLGTIRELQTDPEMPTCTVAIVGGDGTGESRTIVERVNTGLITAGYPRIEKFINQTGTTAELEAAGDAALAEGGLRVNMKATAIEGEQTRYGETFRLGDFVSVEIADGLAVVDQVLSVKLAGTPGTGGSLSFGIGTGSYSDPGQIQIIRNMQRRLGVIERT